MSELITKCYEKSVHMQISVRFFETINFINL